MPLDKPAERPPDFDLAAYWKTSTEELQNAGALRSDAAPRAERRPVAPRSGGRLRRQQPTEPEARGWVTLRVEFEDEEHARFMVLGLAPRVDVIAPASLRDRVAADLAAAMERVLRRRSVADGA